MSSGKNLRSAMLTAGPEGGFSEARPYTVAHLFLCLRNHNDYVSDALMERAGEALNNALDAYRFVTMDPLARSVRVDHDCYYALISVADVPKHMRKMRPEVLLRQIDTLPFSKVIGKGRSHRVGLNSFDDLLAGPVIPAEFLRLFGDLALQPSRLELHHHLVLSSIRRLKRREHALAVLDGESAVESLVGVLTFERLAGAGSREHAGSEMGPGGAIHSLQRRLEYLDQLARSREESTRRFLGSDEETAWRTNLYKLRNRISHEGLRSVSFSEAKAGIVAALRAMDRLQSMNPEFRRSMSWAEAALELGHLQESAGRIARFFET